MVVRTSRRLPGFRFEVQPPPLADVLPRMDVAVFVGFTAAGPLHTPVPVEDAAQFTAIFGEDVPLAWDRQRGETVYAYLAPAVRAFFRNGGRRCWVVRVAGDAQTNYFPIPGLAQVRLDDEGKIVEIRPAFAQARSEGSWSDSLRVSAAMLSQGFLVEQFSLENSDISLTVVSPNTSNDLVEGDLLRLAFRYQEQGYVLMFVVQSVQPLKSDNESSPPVGVPLASTLPESRRVVRVQVRGKTPVWFSTGSSGPLSSPPLVPTQAILFTHDSESAPVSVDDWSILDGTLAQREQTVQLKLTLPLPQAPVPGSLIRVDLAARSFWLTVQEIGVLHLSETGSPPVETLEVTGRGLWQLQDSPPDLLISTLDLETIDCERLNFELWVKQDDANPVRLSDLAFDAHHRYFWDALPTDAQLYQDDSTGAIQQRPKDELYATLWQAAASPRFPLAGSGATNVFYVPIAMPPVPEQFLGPDQLPGTALERNGLSTFDASLFLDPDLIESHTADLMAQADFLRYQSPFPCPLIGIFAALGIEEATLIAVPDAVHRGWLPLDQGHLPEPEPSASPPHPEWWHFLDCSPPPAIPLVHEPQWGNFLNCDIRVISAPELRTSDQPDEHGTFTLLWTLSEPDARYVLQEATSPDFSGAVGLYTGREDRLVIYGRSPGNYYYRVRAEVNGVPSDWSNGVLVHVAPGQRWRLKTIDEYSEQTLIAVQRALLRMCAARGDLLGVLALPEHYREDAAIKYVTTLTSPFGPTITVNRIPKACSPGINTTAVVEPPGFGETSDLSYGSLYHPWLMGREEGQTSEVRRTPPDGAACGIMAHRALLRGAWIAPANELLRGVVALTPAIARERWLSLQEAQINLIRQEPYGFVALSADTLSEDPELRPINVRRLLILLRRLALRLGAIFVFEPNSDAFRRLVQRNFEAMLGQMFARGAFAGSTPDTAFQVVTSSSLNTPQGIEQGRFIIELRVAPSLPMRFLTIRLIQTGDRGVVTEVL